MNSQSHATNNGLFFFKIIYYCYQRKIIFTFNYHHIIRWCEKNYKKYYNIKKCYKNDINNPLGFLIVEVMNSEL